MKPALFLSSSQPSKGFCHMRNVLPIPVLCLVLMLSSQGLAADIDWSLMP